MPAVLRLSMSVPETTANLVRVCAALFGPAGVLNRPTSLTHSGPIATFTAVNPHYRSKGEAVVVEGALVSGSPLNPYNGSFEITGVPSPTSFTYQMASDPGANASGSPAYRYLYQVGRTLIENNVIVLARSYIFQNFAPPAGIALAGAGYSSPGPYIYRQVVIRNNFIRQAEIFTEPTRNATGIRIDSSRTRSLKTMSFCSMRPIRSSFRTVAT